MQAAQHAVGIAHMHHQRGDRSGGAKHSGFRRVGTHAAAAHDSMVGLPVLFEARVIVLVDYSDVDACLHAQAGLLDARLDHSWASDEDG